MAAADARVTALVKKEIARTSENKLIGWRVEDDTQHNSPIGAADCYPLLQTISQGVTSQSRLGDKIKPKSLKVKGVLSYQPDTCSTSQNIYARIVILAQKNIKTGSAVAGGGVDAGHLLRPGLVGAPETSFDGTTEALTYPVNRDLFRVYMDKIVKLTPSLVTGGGREAMPLYSTRWAYNFKSLPAGLSWDAGNGDWANNFAPFLAVGYAFSDGSAADILTTRLIHNVTSILEFEDA